MIKVSTSVKKQSEISEKKVFIINILINRFCKFYQKGKKIYVLRGIAKGNG